MQSQLIAALLAVFAQAAEPAGVRIPGGSATVTLEQRDDGAAAVISVPGQTDQAESSLGSEFIPVLHKGKETMIAVIDLDGDGSDEFFLRVGVPPQAGALWLYRWEKDQKRFVAVRYGKHDYIAVDYGAPVKLDAKGGLEIHSFHTQNGKRSPRKELLRWKGKGYAK